MTKIMIAKHAMIDLKKVLKEFKQCRQFVRSFIGSPCNAFTITNKHTTTSTVIYFLNLTYNAIELVVQTNNSNHVTYLNFNNGDIYSTLYVQPARCMSYLAHFVKKILAELVLKKATIKKIKGEYNDSTNTI